MLQSTHALALSTSLLANFTGVFFFNNQDLETLKTRYGVHLGLWTIIEERYGVADKVTDVCPNNHFSH